MSGKYPLNQPTQTPPANAPACLRLPSATADHLGPWPNCVPRARRDAAAHRVPVSALLKRFCLIAGLIAVDIVASPSRAEEGIGWLWNDTSWGESSRALLAHFDGRATVLPQPIDFGDSYAQLVLRNVNVGGFPLNVFFQMDKATGGLKRIQLERQRHGVNPPAFRGVFDALQAEFGAPDEMCGVRPGPASGYQQAAETVWWRDGRVIRAVFRDTTIEAFEGCLSGDPSFFGPCGLTGQLLVRISPPAQDTAACPVPARAPPTAGR